LVLFIMTLALQMATAADINLEITNIGSNEEFTTDGELGLTVNVKNLAGSFGEAQNVEVAVVGEGVSGSSESVNIGVGESRKIKVRISGFVWEKTRIWLEASGENPDFEVMGDRVGIFLTPAELGLEIVGPGREMKLVDFEEGGSLDIKVLVKNTGKVKLFGVELHILDQSPGLSCDITEGNVQDIEAGKIGRYMVRCNNVSRGKRMKMRVEDENDATFDLSSVEFTLIRPVIPPEPNIGPRIEGPTSNESEDGYGNRSTGNETDTNAPPQGEETSTIGGVENVSSGKLEGAAGDGKTDGVVEAARSDGEGDKIMGIPRVIISLIMIIIPFLILGIYAWVAISRSVPRKKEKQEPGYPIRRV